MFRVYAFAKYNKFSLPNALICSDPINSFPSTIASRGTHVYCIVCRPTLGPTLNRKIEVYLYNTRPFFYSTLLI